MHLFSILAACAALTQPQPDTHVSSEDCREAHTEYHAAIKGLKISPADRQVIARVAYAEASNQGDTGLAGVIYTIINRKISGLFGQTISDIANARNQFESVTKAGGWDSLPTPTPDQFARIDTILNLVLDGRIPDVTNGGLYFQNPAIVADRERAGTVSPGLTHFGGSDASAVIRDHTFYAEVRGAGAKQTAEVTEESLTDDGWDLNNNQREGREIAAAPDEDKWDVYRQVSAEGWQVFTGNKEASK